MGIFAVSRDTMKIRAYHSKREQTHELLEFVKGRGWLNHPSIPGIVAYKCTKVRTMIVLVVNSKGEKIPIS